MTEPSDSSTNDVTKLQEALTVSVAGDSESMLGQGSASVEDSMAAALDDAVAKLGAAVANETTAEDAASAGKCTTGDNVDSQLVTASLIHLLLQSPSRRDAIVALVGFLEEHAGASTVRCGFGKSKLVQIYDRRFGWLGAESSLYEEMATHWEAPRRRESDPSEEKAVAICSGNTLRLVLPNENASARYEVWVSGIEVNTETLAWFTPVLSVVALAIWNRPMRSLPVFAKRLAQRSKTTAAIVVMTLVLLAVWPVQYRIASNARIETAHQRFVSAPFDATLLTAKVKPGDRVSQGEVLLVLDGRPLRLERESIEAEMQQAAKEHDVALVTGRVADAQQAALKEQQLRRQHDLLSDRLGRLEVVSPIDGVVVSGDLRRYEGSTLDRGQTLLEVAPMDKMVLEVELPEYEIGYVVNEAQTRVKIDAIGGRSFTLPLQDVFPRSELRDDQNVFIGRIELDNADGKLRPGMQGEATTYGPLRPWIWSWVRSGVERTMWSIGY